MNPQSISVARKLLLLFVVALGSISMLKGMFSIAETTDEREIEDKIPKHVPIKVKIRSEKEKAFKDLNNDHWVRDLELEVTNTSDKPIYYLDLWIILPEVFSPNGNNVAFTLRYGRPDFIYFGTLARPDDVPIQPGARYTYKIPEDSRKGWEAYREKEHINHPKKIQITFTQLSFGDGSGFNGTDAMPYPYKKDLSKSDACREGPKQVADEGRGNQLRSLVSIDKAHSFSIKQPASPPVNFLMVKRVTAVSVCYPQRQSSASQASSTPACVQDSFC